MTSKRMDVTSDKNLFDFIESLGKEEQDLTTTTTAAAVIKATSCYTVGCIFVKRDIITYLLELYTLGQINQSLLH